MDSGRISGQTPISSGRTSGAEGAQVQGDYKGVAVTANPNAGSLVNQAKANVPHSSPQKTLKSRGKGKKSKSGESEGVDEKEDKKKDEKKAKKSRRVVRISDVDKSTKEQYEGFAAKLKRDAKIKQYQTIQDYLEAIDEHFGEGYDITNKYEALNFARDELEKDKEFENTALGCDNAARTLYKEQGPEIRAGWILSDYGQDKVQFYRQTVLDREYNIPTTFQNVIKNGGIKQFESNLNMLREAIEKDVAASESTMEPAHLRDVQNSLRVVSVCATVYKDAGHLLTSYYKAIETA